MAIFLVACDTVTDHYSTLRAARDDRLFERGWLPDILPESSVDIVTCNELDLNLSEGSFTFEVEDGAEFYSLLEKGLPPSTRYRNWSEIVDDFPLGSYSRWWFRGDRGTWAFFCDEREGKCWYYAW